MSKDYTSTSWDLSDLFTAADSPQMKAAFADLDIQTAAFEARRAQLAANISETEFFVILQQIGVSDARRQPRRCVCILEFLWEYPGPGGPGISGARRPVPHRPAEP